MSDAPLSNKIDGSSSEIEELGFIPPWDAVITPVEPVPPPEPLWLNLDPGAVRRLLVSGTTTFASEWMRDAPRFMDEEDINLLLISLQSAYQAASTVLSEVSEVFAHRHHLRHRGRKLMADWNITPWTRHRHHHRRHHHRHHCHRPLVIQAEPAVFPDLGEVPLDCPFVYENISD